MSLFISISFCQFLSHLHMCSCRKFRSCKAQASGNKSTENGYTWHPGTLVTSYPETSTSKGHPRWSFRARGKAVHFELMTEVSGYAKTPGFFRLHDRRGCNVRNKPLNKIKGNNILKHFQDVRYNRFQGIPHGTLAILVS